MSPRTTATLAALTLAVPLGLAGTAIAGDKGQGEEHRADAPGQQVREEHAAQPAAPQGQANGQENRVENQAGAPPAHAQNDDPKPAAQQPAKQQAAKQKVAEKKAARQTAPKSQGNGPKAEGNGPAPQAHAGKTTICHATGSETNPYVTITVSDNALKAHDRHQNDEDIIPAPAGGCPGATDGPAKTNGNGPDGKVTICHATGSETNPFVIITISENAVDAHRNHQDGEDIIPAPGNGICVTPTLPTLTETLTTVTEKLTTLTTPPTNPPAALTPAGNVLGDFAEGGPDEAADDQVAPGAANGGDTTDRRESGADAAAASGGELPFTGLELAIVIALGLAALLTGVAMHRSLGRDAG